MSAVASQTETPTQKGGLVLLVDDDARTARRMAQMLREDGFIVEVVRDGSSAIARLTRPPVPEILVTDLRMTEVDGLSVARFARSQRPGLPIFVVTGYPNLLCAKDFGEPSPIVFTKPIEYDQLSAQLANALAILHPEDRDLRGPLPADASVR